MRFVIPCLCYAEFGCHDYTFFHYVIPIISNGYGSCQNGCGLMFNVIPECVQVIHAACEITVFCNLFFVQCSVFIVLIVNPVRIDGIVFPVRNSEHKTAFIDFEYRLSCCGIRSVCHFEYLPFFSWVKPWGLAWLLPCCVESFAHRYGPDGSLKHCLASFILS